MDLMSQAAFEKVPLKVQDIGEQGLLNRLQCFCPPAMVGDDAAIITPTPGQSLVVTTDGLVDGVHFSIGLANPEIHTTTPEDAGWRAAAANLSDLAAMGALPLAITVSLGVPGDTPVALLERLYRGLTECLQLYGAVIVGGDVYRSPVLSLVITAFGQVAPNWVIRRSLAQPGDVILVTGVHGVSRAGLELLLHPELKQRLTDEDYQSLVRSHQRPKPRLDVLPLLWNSALQRDPTPRMAGMDSSDGLADAVVQICRASGVGARLARHQILTPTAATWITPEQAVEWALYGGEDFELVLCLPGEIAQAIRQQLGSSAAIIGTVTVEPEVKLVDGTGQYPDRLLTLEQGFQHF